MALAEKGANICIIQQTEQSTVKSWALQSYTNVHSLL